MSGCLRCLRCHGLTLFETTLVLALILLLSLLAVPALMRTIDSYQLTAAAHQVRSELHRARILSIVRNEDCRLRVTSSTTYLIECQTPVWVEIQDREMPQGFLISANSRPEFHPLGNVGPMATVRVWNVAGEHRRVIVNRSGRIRLE